MPRKTRKRVKPKRRGNSIKFKHRLIRGGSIPKRTPGITKEVSGSPILTGRKASLASAKGIKKYEKELETRVSTTQLPHKILARSRGNIKSPRGWLEGLQKTRNKPNPRMAGGRKTRKKGNKSMKRRC